MTYRPLQEAVCPKCGSNCRTLFLVDDEVVGCDWCVTQEDAYNYLEEEHYNAYLLAEERV